MDEHGDMPFAPPVAVMIARLLMRALVSLMALGVILYGAVAIQSGDYPRGLASAAFGAITLSMALRS